MNRFVAVLGAAALAASGVALPPAVTAVSAAPAVATLAQSAAARVGDDFTPAALQFGTCASPLLQSLGAECGLVEVPLDYAHPGGAKIKLSVSRIRATVPAADYQGVVLVNPGGPGGAGLLFSFLGLLVPHNVGASYDWIGFDPRGVGTSQPALTCDPGYLAPGRPPYLPGGPNEQNWLGKARTYAARCQAAGGPLLEHMKTTDNVADMDSIRKALGQSQINYYGVSYGTYLGQAYATLHPDRLRRAVFDSNVDPRLVWYPHQYQQDAGLEDNVQQFYDWVAGNDSRYHLGTTRAAVAGQYQAELRRLTRAPGLIGPDEFTDVIYQAAVTVFSYAGVADAFATLVNTGDAGGVLALYQTENSYGSPGADNTNAAYLATKCTDAPWPTDYPTWRHDTTLSARQAPFFSWGNTWSAAPCMFWDAAPGTPVRIGSSTAPSILLVNETFDSLTPISGDLTVRDLFPHSALIEGVGGRNHAVALDGNECVDNQIADYLATGALPTRRSGHQADTTCPPLQIPPLDQTRPATTSTATTGRPDLPTLRAILRTAAARH